MRQWPVAFLRELAFSQLPPPRARHVENISLRLVYDTTKRTRTVTYYSPRDGLDEFDLRDHTPQDTFGNLFQGDEDMILCGVIDWDPEC
jgi:hypothetical protein